MNGDTVRRERRGRGQIDRKRERKRERRNTKEGRSGSSSRVYCIVQRVRQSTMLPPCPSPPPGCLSSTRVFDARAHACTYAHPRAQCRSRVYRRECIECILSRWRFPLSPSRACGLRNASIERHRHEITITRRKSPRNMKVFKELCDK